jgi:hypothetical protein
MRQLKAFFHVYCLGDHSLAKKSIVPVSHFATLKTHSITPTARFTHCSWAGAATIGIGTHIKINCLWHFYCGSLVYYCVLDLCGSCEVFPILFTVACSLFLTAQWDWHGHRSTTTTTSHRHHSTSLYYSKWPGCTSFTMLLLAKWPGCTSFTQLLPPGFPSTLPSQPGYDSWF